MTVYYFFISFFFNIFLAICTLKCWARTRTNSATCTFTFINFWSTIRTLLCYCTYRANT